MWNLETYNKTIIPSFSQQPNKKKVKIKYRNWKFGNYRKKKHLFFCKSNNKCANLENHRTTIPQFSKTKK